MTEDHVAVDRLLLDLAEGGLKNVIDNREVRGMCRAALRNAGCMPPADALVYFAVSKFVVLGAAKLSDGYSARLLAWMQRFKPAALVMRRIADICLKESNRNKLKDRLIAEMKGEAGPERPDFGTEAELEIQQQIYAMKRFDSIDADLGALVALVQGLIAERSAEGIAPRLGWDAGSTLSLSDTIRYNSGAYSFVGREDDLDFLRRFLASEGHFGWLLLTGEGGEGKTRLAMEFTQRHLPEGWTGGRLSMGDLERFDPSLWIPAAPTCIVIDYPAQNPVGVRNLMANVARAAAANLYDWPVRLILLERDTAGDWYRELLPETSEGSGLRSFAFREPPQEIGAKPRVYDRGRPLTPINRAGLLAMMRQRFEDEGFAAPADQELWANLTRIDPRQRNGEPAPRPIFAAAVAESMLNRARDGDDDTLVDTAYLNRIGLLRSMIARDRQSRWQPEASTPASLVLHENLLAMASFAYGLEKRQIQDLPDPVKDYLPSPGLHGPVPVEPDLLRMMAGFDSGRIAPLEPDLLGEIHLIERLTAIREDGGDLAFRAFADGALAIGGEQAVTVAMRAVKDFPELMPDLGWMIPADRAGSEFIPQDARLAVDLVTSLPLAQVAQLMDWFDRSLDAAPDDLEVALFATRAAWNSAVRATASLSWDREVARQRDRLTIIESGDDADKQLFLRSIRLCERLVAAFPADIEIQLTLARILRLLAVANQPEDQSPANQAVRDWAETQAWRALDLSEAARPKAEYVLSGDSSQPELASPVVDGGFRPGAYPRPAGLSWSRATPEDAARMARLVARETLIAGHNRWLSDAGASAVWRAPLLCSHSHEVWAFDLADHWATHVVLLSDGHTVHLCDGSSAVLLRLAHAGAFAIDTPDRARNYLVLFSGLIRGNAGPFEIIQSINDLTVTEQPDDAQRALLAELIRPVAVAATGNSFKARANVSYGPYLFSAELEIERNGAVTMIDDEPLGEFPMLAQDRYSGIHRTYAETRHVELAAKLLRDAAHFFTSLAATNPALEQSMTENADAFTLVARMAASDPLADHDGTPYHKIASLLLRDAAKFFESLADQSPDIAEQMRENARVFRQVADLAERDPMGTLSIIAEQTAPAPDTDG